MLTTGPIIATSACATNRGNAALGLLVILLFLGTIALFATLNAQARRKLAVANAELAYLRSELAGARVASGATGSGPASWPTGAGWYPDPTRRHEYRQWTGQTWSDGVSDGGVTSSDPFT